MNTNKPESVPYFNESSVKANLSNGIWGSLVGILIAISPKCPFCWAAYLSMFGLSGVIPLGVYQWITPVLAILFVIHLYVIGRRAFRSKHFLPLYLSGLGFASVILGFYIDIAILRHCGVAFILAGSITNALPKKKSPTSCSCSNSEKTTIE